MRQQETGSSENEPAARSAQSRKQPWQALLGNVSWTLVGNVVYAGCQWAMLTVIAKTLNPEAVGTFSLALAVTAPVIVFSQLQLRAIQATDVQATVPFSAYLGLRMLMTALALLVIAVVSRVLHYDLPTTIIILIIALSKAVESISDCIFGLVQQHLKLKRMAVSLMIKGTASLLVLAASVRLFHSLVLGVSTLLLSWTAVLLFYDLPTAAFLIGSNDNRGKRAAWFYGIRPSFNAATAKALLKQALPLGISSMLYTLAPNVPRYFLEHASGRHDLGIYSALAYIVIAGTVLINAIGTAIVPILARQYAVRDFRSYSSTLAALCLGTLVMGAAIVAVAAIAGPFLLRHLYGAEYAKYESAFLWVMIAGGASYLASMLGYGIVATRRFAVQVPVHIAVTAVVAGMCSLVLPAHGITGAAWSVLAGAITAAAVTIAVIAQGIVRNYIRQPIRHSGLLPLEASELT